MTAPRRPVRLIVDSTTNLPLDRLRAWDIPVVPALVNMGTQSVLDDPEHLDLADMYARMRRGDPVKTAAMSQGAVLEAYEQVLPTADHILVFCAGAAYSSINNTFKLAAQKVAPDRITVYDSGSLSMGTGYPTIAAAEAAVRGATIQEVLAVTAEMRARTQLNVIIDDLNHLRRSGRISVFVAGIGTLLQLKPMLELKDGHATSIHRARTMTRAIEYLVDLAHKDAPFEALSILHVDNAAGAARVEAMCRDIMPMDTQVIEASPSIGVHIGPGCLALCYVKHKADAAPTPVSASVTAPATSQ